MRPLAEWSREDRRQLIGVFTDIDDTLTTEGAITPDALQALNALRTAGLPVIPITGRPIGWCEPLMRGDGATGMALLPVQACVAENGAVAFVRNDNQLTKLYQQDAPTRAAHFTRMQAVAAEIVREVRAAIVREGKC